MKNSTSILLFLLFFFSMSSCNFNSAHIDIDDVKMCTIITDNQCLSDHPVFSPSTEEIYVSCQLKNAPENTNIEFSWYYLGKQKIKIDAVTLNSGNKLGTLDLQSSLSRPNNGWPAGEYEVSIKILDTEKEPVIKKFNVK